MQPLDFEASEVTGEELLDRLIDMILERGGPVGISLQFEDGEAALVMQIVAMDELLEEGLVKDDSSTVH